jgi:hypothetical protein
MSGEEVRTEISSEVPDSHVPEWLVLSLIVMGGGAGYTLLAYLLWLWAS